MSIVADALYRWEFGLRPPDGIFRYFADHQKNLTAISIVDRNLHSHLTPSYVTAALKPLDLKSFSWIGLWPKRDVDVISLLAGTQHKSLQDLQLVFSEPPSIDVESNHTLPSWRPQDKK